MQPGSSTSFAGNSRVGRAASFTVNGKIKRVKIAFNPSDKRHLQKLGNMMEDRAFLGGVQGFTTDDEWLFRSHELARETGISYEFDALEKDNGYPSSVQFDIENTAGEKGRLIGASVGGGMVVISEINSFPVLWRGDSHALLLTGIQQNEQSVRNFTVAFAEANNLSFVEAAVEYEKRFSGWDEKKIWGYFEHIRDILYHQIHALEELGYDNVPDTPLLPVYGRSWNRYKNEGKTLQDPLAA
ncbi:MAG: hypothetical protein LBB68_05245, partial [Treponema sp.]|nr:hypothetical protein [Treponema sp.]